MTIRRHYTQGAPRNPIRIVLRRIMGKAPPKYVQGYDYSNLTDVQHTRLQEWVGMNLPDSIFWSTAIGVIDAAENIVAEAVGNANIPAKDDENAQSDRPRRKRKARRK